MTISVTGKIKQRKIIENVDALDFTARVAVCFDLKRKKDDKNELKPVPKTICQMNTIVIT
jgi:hypothetical protein